VAIGLAAVGLSGAVAAAPAAANGAVSIHNFAFAPGSVTVNVGDSVTWTYNDGFGHTATSQAGAPAAFDSGTLNGGRTFMRAFTVAGTYNYQCAIHGASMSGTITVAAAPVAAPSSDSTSSAPPADQAAPPSDEAAPPSDEAAPAPSDAAPDTGTGDVPTGDDSTMDSDSEM
jgi:plastocyanin